eukprot:TRINITY_DN13116_c0_g3_i1.p1 TRINITY_DN13116_c0_g3~~TRINITY_DN13116_c0_g3_i1.p1  ORF type:complete len:538 (+),score=161.30 TRINITY_DN13116_c0_g3_i1:73-1686(+)
MCIRDSPKTPKPLGECCGVILRHLGGGFSKYKETSNPNRDIMRPFILLACLCLSLADTVRELTDLTFQESIDNNPIIMVLFYSPWCNTCKKAKSEFTAAAKLAATIKKSYVFAQIDGSVQAEAADKVGIMSFPLVLLYVDKKRIEYGNGEITGDALVRFINKQVRPPSVELKMKEEVLGLKESKGIKCILFSNDNKTLESYVEVANIIKEIPFYQMTEENAKIYFPEVKKTPAVMILTDKSEEKFMLDSDLTKDSITQFIELNRFPALNLLTKDTGVQILKPNGRTGVLFFVNKKDPNLGKYTEEFRKVAAKHKSIDKMFILAVSDNELYERILKHFNYDESKVPFIVITKRDYVIAKYEYKGEFTTEGIEKFIEDFDAGKVEESIKSEDVPVDNKGPVYKLVGRTFRKEVIDSDVDVFVKFYAPWCTHCKTLAPVYEELAEMVKDGNKLKLMEIDATANELSGYIIDSYPTLRYFPRKFKDNSREYSGNRKLDDMLKFLKENYDGELIVKEAKSKGSSNEADDGAKCDSSCKDKPS